jgi:hypothetical protein
MTLSRIWVSFLVLLFQAMATHLPASWHAMHCALVSVFFILITAYFTNQCWQVVPGFVIHFRGDVSLICSKKQKQKTDGHGLLYRKG